MNETNNNVYGSRRELFNYCLTYESSPGITG